MLSYISVNDRVSDKDSNLLNASTAGLSPTMRNLKPLVCLGGDRNRPAGGNVTCKACSSTANRDLLIFSSRHH